jgi:hypothetical protein
MPRGEGRSPEDFKFRADPSTEKQEQPVLENTELNPTVEELETIGIEYSQKIPREERRLSAETTIKAVMSLYKDAAGKSAGIFSASERLARRPDVIQNAEKTNSKEQVTKSLEAFLADPSRYMSETKEMVRRTFHLPLQMTDAVTDIVYTEGRSKPLDSFAMIAERIKNDQNVSISDAFNEERNRLNQDNEQRLAGIQDRKTIMLSFLNSLYPQLKENKALQLLIDIEEAGLHIPNSEQTKLAGRFNRLRLKLENQMDFGDFTSRAEMTNKLRGLVVRELQKAYDDRN